MRFETIVREVRKALPFCDIVTVLVTDKRRSDDALEGRLHAQAQAHDDVAAAYGIPSVKAGLALAAKYGDALHARWSDFFTDIVHMTAAGYDEYYQCIEAYLGSALAEGNIGEKKAHTLPPLFSETLFDGDRQTLQATNNLLQKSEALGGFGFSFSEKYFGLHDYNGYFYAEQGGENPVLVLEFEGTEIAICSNVATGVAREESVWCFAVSVDGGEWQRRNFKTHNPTMLAENLPAGRHEIKFQPLFETFEKDETFKLGIIFTRNAETQSHK